MLNRKEIIILSVVAIFLVRFNVSATNVEVTKMIGVVNAEGVIEDYIPKTGGGIACGGGESYDGNDVSDYEYDNNVVDETKFSGVRRYTFNEDPYTIVEVDSEGNEKYIHLPLEDITIDYDKVNYKKAKYNYEGDRCIITYGNDTYVVSGKDAAGFYTTVDINGKRYSIERYQKIAAINDYEYKGKQYEVDEDGYIVGYRQEWIDWGYGMSGYGDTKLLFRKEVPFNILWKHRPLTDEEKELLYSGPGVELKSFSTGVSDTGIANVVVNRKPEVADVEDTGVGYTKMVTVDDPLDPMKAKSVKKNKNNN